MFKSSNLRICDWQNLFVNRPALVITWRRFL